METTQAPSKSKQEQAHPSPEHILQIGTGFWASKTLLAALKFRLFTLLAKGPLSAKEIQSKTGVNDRSLYDFLDTLVALGFLNREGLKENAKYSNTIDTDLFLDKNKPSYLGGILEMCNNRLYKYWADLEEGLITGKPQNELKQSQSNNAFDDLYSNPDSLAEFMQAMAGIQMGAFMAFAKKFDFSNYKTLCDAGGAMGALSVQVAANNPHMKCISYDLQPVEKIAAEFVKKNNLADRVKIQSGNFFETGIPKADIVTMGNILHDWNEQEKLALIRKAYNALPAGGAFVCIENIIDNDRRQNAFGLLMSLNMLIETKGGSDYTYNDFCSWVTKVGFKKTEWIQLAGPTSAAVAYK